MHFSNHVNTAIGITPSPLINDSVWFGAIDVDTYDMDFEQKKKLIKTAHELRLAVEQTLSGGFGSIICETLADIGLQKNILRIGLPDRYIFENGDRNYLLNNNGLSVESIYNKVSEFVNE